MEEEGRFTKLWFCIGVVLFAVISFTTVVYNIRETSAVLSEETFELTLLIPTSSIYDELRKPPYNMTIWFGCDILNNPIVCAKESMVIVYYNSQVTWWTKNLEWKQKLVCEVLGETKFLIREETADEIGKKKKNPNPLCLLSDDLWFTAADEPVVIDSSV